MHVNIVNESSQSLDYLAQEQKYQQGFCICELRKALRFSLPTSESTGLIPVVLDQSGDSVLRREEK